MESASAVQKRVAYVPFLLRRKMRQMRAVKKLRL